MTKVVPWAPGGSTDAFARVPAARPATELGRPFPFDDRGGADGTIGSQHVPRARPDGFTPLPTGTGT